MNDTASSSRGRYKDTPVFNDAVKGGYFGVLEVPSEFAALTPADYTHYSVTSADVGFPDNIAVEMYGLGFEDLWWVIALANGIIDTESELYVGRTLLIPPRSAVSVFMTRV